MQLLHHERLYKPIFDFPPFYFASFRYYDIVRDVRQNKGSILKASVEYIRKLKSDQHKKRLMEEKLKQQDAQNKKLLLKIQVKTSTLSRIWKIFSSGQL